MEVSAWRNYEKQPKHTASASGSKSEQVEAVCLSLRSNDTILPPHI